MLLNCDVGEDSSESLELQEDQTSPSSRKSVLNIHWKDWCWSWSSNTLATWWEELIHWKRPWCWERLKAGREGKTENETVGWHHQPDGHEPEQASGVGDGQGNLVCCGPWGHKESDTTERLNWAKPVFLGNLPWLKHLLFVLLHHPTQTFVIAFTFTVFRDFPGGLEAKTPHSQCRGPGFNPWSGS